MKDRMTQEEKDAACEEISKRLKQEHEKATRRGIVLVQLSPRKWMAVKIDPGTIIGVFSGKPQVAGPKEDVLDWIRAQD